MYLLILISCSTATFNRKKTVQDGEWWGCCTIFYYTIQSNDSRIEKNNLLANNTAEGQRINQIGRRISKAVEEYLIANGMQDKIKLYNGNLT